MNDKLLVIILSAMIGSMKSCIFDVNGTDVYFNTVISKICSGNDNDCYGLYYFCLNYSNDVAFVCYTPSNNSACMLPNYPTLGKYVSFGLTQDLSPIIETIYYANDFVINFNAQCMNFMNYKQMYAICITDNYGQIRRYQ